VESAAVMACVCLCVREQCVWFAVCVAVSACRLVGNRVCDSFVPILLI